MAWGKADFDKFYSASAERWGHPGNRPGIRLHYHWWPILQWQRTYAQRLYDVLSLQAGQDIILVGAGFNATGEGLADLGVRVIGTDLSNYIHAEKSNTEEADIRAACIAAGVDPDTDSIIGPAGSVNPLDLWMRGGRASPKTRGWGQIIDQDMRTNGSRNSIINAFQSQYPSAAIRYIVSEEVLNSITDAEASLVCDYMSGAGGSWGSTCVHMLSPLQTENTQAPELNWKTYAGWRTWLDTNGYASHLIIPTVTASGQGMHFPDRQTVIDAALAKLLAMGRDFAAASTKAVAAGDAHVANERVLAYSGTI